MRPFTVYIYKDRPVTRRDVVQVNRLIEEGHIQDGERLTKRKLAKLVEKYPPLPRKRPPGPSRGPF